MDNVAKNRWQVRIAAMIIFVLGFTAGILALNVYRRLDRGGPGNRMDELAERLQLTAEQKTRFRRSSATRASSCARRARRWNHGWLRFVVRLMVVCRPC